VIRGAGVDLVGATFRRRYRSATAVPIATRTRVSPSQLRATATRKFRGGKRPKGGEIAKKQLQSAERADTANTRLSALLGDTM